MRTWLLLFILAPLHLYAQVTRDVRAYNITGRIQEPRQFLWTNVLAGANISVDWNADGTITINGGAGGGTNALVTTNGVIVGSIGTLNFVRGITGHVAGAVVNLGVDNIGGSGASITVASNYIITTPTITNLNFVMGTNIFIVVTNNSGDASVWINVDKYAITNGLATISYVNQATQFVVTAHGDITLTNNMTVLSGNVISPTIGGRYAWFGTESGSSIGLYSDYFGGSYIASYLPASTLWVYADGKYQYSGSSDANNFFATYNRFYGPLIPDTDNTKTFGSNTIRWKEGWVGDYLEVSNTLRAGYLSISNMPGTQLGYIELRSTNGNSYLKISRLSDTWMPTNYILESITNPVINQILSFANVSIASGVASILLTNRTLEWLDFSTNMVASTATNRTKYLSNIWGDVGMVLVPADGEVLKYDSAMGRWTNKTDNGGSGSPGGIVGNIQVHGTGGTFVGSTNSFFDVTNNRMDIGLDSRAMFAAGRGNLNITNIYLGRPGILLIGTNHANMANFLALDDTGLQNSKGLAIHFTFDGDNSSPPNNIASSGNGITLTNDSVKAFPVLFPKSSGSEQIMLGYETIRFETNWVRTIDASSALVLRDNNSKITGGRTIFTHLNDFKPTNLFRFSVTNPVAGQVLKFAAVNNIATSTKEIILTNDIDNSGGAGSIAFNPNQFMPSATHTNIKEFYLTTNAIIYSTNVSSTNVVIPMIASSAGAALSILNSSGALITEFNSNGFLVVTNFLTNYSLGNTLKAPTNTIVLGVENDARNRPSWTDDEGIDYDSQVSFADNRIFIITTGTSTSPQTLGINIATPAGGTTISHPVDAARHLPYMVALATGAVSNNCAALGSAVDLASAGVHNGSTRMSGYFFSVEWADTNNISGIVGGGASRSFVGLTALANTAMTNLVVTTNATGQYLGLMSDPKQSLEMFISARDSGNEFRTNTGINFVATNIYHVNFYQSPTNRFVKWKVRDLTARTEAAGWFSNNVPTNFMKMVIATKNGTNRAHSIRFSKLYLEAPLVPR